MVAAQTIAGEDSLLTTLLGFGLLTVFVAVVAALHVKRWRRRGFAPGVRRLVHRTRTRRLSSPALPALAGSHARAAPEAANASAAGSSQSAPSGAAPEIAGPAAPSRSFPEGVAAPAAPTPRLRGARHSPETLEPLAQQVDHTRRLAVAEERVATVLAALPRDRSLVERYVLIRGHRVPFLILGETGVFALWPLSGPPQWRDPAFVTEVAAHVKNRLPGYAGPVRAGICRAFAPAVRPRWWCRPGEAGAWVMGLDWVIPWLENFGPDHGLSVTDVERFNALAGPHWERPVARGVPGIPDVD